MAYYVYILTNRNHTVLYTGVTNTLKARVQAHISGEASQFTDHYLISKLVYYETHADVNDALRREKALKRWHRSWKEALISQHNPTWEDWAAEWR
jgi:putative endonuclease